MSLLFLDGCNGESITALLGLDFSLGWTVAGFFVDHVEQDPRLVSLSTPVNSLSPLELILPPKFTALATDYGLGLVLIHATPLHHLARHSRVSRSQSSCLNSHSVPPFTHQPKCQSKACCPRLNDTLARPALVELSEKVESQRLLLNIIRVPFCLIQLQACPSLSMSKSYLRERLGASGCMMVGLEN